MKKLVSLAVLIPFVGACGLVPLLSGDHSDSPDSPRTVPPVPFEVSRTPLEPAKPLTTLIMVVDKVSNKNWRVKEAVLSWQPAKYTVIKFVKECPAEWRIPCVTIQEVNDMDTTYAAEANHGALPGNMKINLNGRVDWISGPERETTVCHEFGHILGLGHATGSRNTCMWDGNYYRKWPLGATKLDIQAVDSLGEWDLEKMYESSGKTLDFRPQPK